MIETDGIYIDAETGRLYREGVVTTIDGPSWEAWELPPAGPSLPFGLALSARMADRPAYGRSYIGTDGRLQHVTEEAGMDPRRPAPGSVGADGYRRGLFGR